MIGLLLPVTVLGQLNEALPGVHLPARLLQTNPNPNPNPNPDPNPNLNPNPNQGEASTFQTVVDVGGELYIPTNVKVISWLVASRTDAPKLDGVLKMPDNSSDSDSLEPWQELVAKH